MDEEEFELEIEEEEDLDCLYDADPNCQHEIYSPAGGGIKCRKCTGWFCF